MIASRSGGVQEVVIDGVTGILVAPDNPEEIAHAVKQVLVDTDYARQLGQNGRRHVEEEMNWRLGAEKVDDILCSLADGQTWVAR